MPDRASIQTGTATPVTTTFDAASRPTTDSAGDTYTSDKEGRITGLPGQTLIYDALGRLSQVKNSSGTVVLATYTYDALDRLRTSTEGGVTTRFLYVGLTSAVAQTINASTGAVISNFATDLSGTELFDFTLGGLVQTYLGRDSHDDVTWTAGSTGAVSSTAAYDPFGNLVASTGSVPNSRWQSSYQDSVTGLYYVLARWYAPGLGTFLSDDPLTAAQTDPQARDPYAYAAGDVTDGVDPDGSKALPSPFPTNPVIDVPPLPVPYFSQTGDKGTHYGAPWWNTHLGFNSSWPTIAAQGCSLTSVSMVTRFYWQYWSGASIDPHSCNVCFSNHRAYGTDGDLSYTSTLGKLVGLTFGKLTVKTSATFKAVTKQTVLFKLVRLRLQQGYPLIAKLGHKPPLEHFVVVTGLWTTDFIINDPAQPWPHGNVSTGRTSGPRTGLFATYGNAGMPLTALWVVERGSYPTCPFGHYDPRPRWAPIPI